MLLLQKAERSGACLRRPAAPFVDLQRGAQLRGYALKSNKFTVSVITFDKPGNYNLILRELTALIFSVIVKAAIIRFTVDIVADKNAVPAPRLPSGRRNVLNSKMLL